MQPFDISLIPQIIDVTTSFLNGENAVISSHITEKNTIYTVIFTIADAVSLTEVVNELLAIVFSHDIFDRLRGTFFLNKSPYIITEKICIT